MCRRCQVALEGLVVSSLLLAGDVQAELLPLSFLLGGELDRVLSTDEPVHVPGDFFDEELALGDVVASVRVGGT